MSSRSNGNGNGHAKTLTFLTGSLALAAAIYALFAPQDARLASIEADVKQLQQDMREERNTYDEWHTDAREAIGRLEERVNTLWEDRP